MLRGTSSHAGEVWSAAAVLTVMPTPYLWLLAVAMAGIGMVAAAASLLSVRRLPF